MANDLTPRQLEVLHYLSDTEFLRPMDVGGRDGSHHSATLAALAKRGLVDRKKLHAIHCPHGSRRSDGTLSTRCRCKGSCTYRRFGFVPAEKRKRARAKANP